MTPYLQPSWILPGGIIAVRDYPAVQEPYVELGFPGLDPAEPCLDIYSFDSSGSVTAPQGNDPVGNRFVEATRAIKLVASWSHSSRSKIALLHFDHPRGASGVHPLNDKQLMHRLKPSLRVPPLSVGTSDLEPSLSAAERLAAAHPDHNVRFTVFSDFELTDVDPSGVISRLVAFPGRVHAVVLGGSPPLDLVADTITITPITPQDAPGTFAAAIHRSLTATRRGRRYSVLHTPRGGKQVLP